MEALNRSTSTAIRALICAALSLLILFMLPWIRASAQSPSPSSELSAVHQDQLRLMQKVEELDKSVALVSASVKQHIEQQAVDRFPERVAVLESQTREINYKMNMLLGMSGGLLLAVLGELIHRIMGTTGRARRILSPAEPAD